RASRGALEAAEQEKEAGRQRELAQARALAEEQRQRAEDAAKAARTLRWRAVLAGLIAFVAVGAAVYAVSQRQEAQQKSGQALAVQATAEVERDRAEQQRAFAEKLRKTALSRQLAAQAQTDLGGQVDLALLLSL